MPKLPSFIEEFIKKFRNGGYQIYLVGGSVRELLIGKNVQWNFADFATNATPQEIQKLYPSSFYENIYGTVGVRVKHERKEYIFEVTTFRKEGEYKDLRHPEKIKWAKKVQDDLSRRDFTINAMAYDGERIIDLFNGQKHLKERLIVAVGDPDKRFREDALRLIRAVRFAAEFGFLIEEKTRESIKKNADLITKIAAERVRDELFKILASNNPADGIFFLRNVGLLAYILPEVDIAFAIAQKSPKRHHIFDVGTHLVLSLKHCKSKDVITRFATLLHDIGKSKTFKKDEATGLITFYNHEVVGAKMAGGIANRLRLSKKEKHKLVTLVRHHQFTVTELQTDRAVRRFIRNVGKEYLQDMIDLRIGDRIGGAAAPTSWRLELFKKRLEEVQKEPFTVHDLKIDGNDVMKTLKIKPGPKVGEILNKLFQEVEEGKLKNNRKALLRRIKSLA